MCKTAQLRADDLRTIYRLVGECRDLGDDPMAWRLHLSQSVAKFADADFAMAGEMANLRVGLPRSIGAAIWGMENGFNEAGMAVAMETFENSPNHVLAVSMTSYAAHLRKQDGFAATRRELVPDDEWYHSFEYQRVNRVVGVDHTLRSFRSISGVAGDELSGLLLARSVGRRDFPARTTAFIRELQAAIAPLNGRALTRFQEPSPAGLPPKMRQVLRCLLEGDSDKQIATRLRISPYTVNQYVKVIFKHFGVSARAELLSRWVRRGWGARFTWADAV